jgi:hypothetical protein
LPLPVCAAAAKKTKLGQKYTAALDAAAPLRKPNQGNLGLLADYIRSRRLVDKMIKKGKLVFHTTCDDAFRRATMEDLYKVASTKTGRKVLRDIKGSKHKVTFEPLNDPDVVRMKHHTAGPNAWPENGPGANTTGSDTRVRLDHNYPKISQGTPGHRITAHELGHARNNALGRNAQVDPPPPGFDRGRWSDLEEWNNIHGVDNPYGKEWGLPERSGHNDMLPDPAPMHLPRTTNPGMGAAGPTPGPGSSPGPGGTLPGVGPDLDAANTLPRGMPAQPPGGTPPGPAPDFDAADTFPR